MIRKSAKMYPNVMATPTLTKTPSFLIGLDVVSGSNKKQYKLIVLTTTACKFEPILVSQSVFLVTLSPQYPEEIPAENLGLTK